MPPLFGVSAALTWNPSDKRTTMPVTSNRCITLLRFNPSMDSNKRGTRVELLGGDARRLGEVRVAALVLAWLIEAVERGEAATAL